MTERTRARGRVHLVGAGPGDPELLTVKAARVIGEADVILVDDLVDRRVLRHARPDARVLEVGKRGGCRSTPQQFIETLMVRFARAGSVVARVKGGDPYVFGRGGEEAIALTRAGVEFEVVPGVSSGIAAPASAGIPVTHRGVASAVTFVTAHGAQGSTADWKQIARCPGTLVIFMGVKPLGAIVEGLVAGGLAADTPAAVIERATWADQRVLRASLGDLAAQASRAGVGSPAIVVIGRTVALADAIGAAMPAGALEQVA